MREIDMKRYITRCDGEWVDVTDGEFLQCCDCSLVHYVDYRIIVNEDDTRSIIRSMTRDKRRTAACRAVKKKKRKKKQTKK